ncbi:MAG: PAS domain S-box protein [Chloroflexi bacterium]|nr:PAS domain S-box protein [Chloroflexota bacterium]
MSIPSSPNSLLSKEELLLRLEEAEETLRAIRSGEVDALVVAGEQGDQVFTLKDASLPYQILIEEMNEGALTLSPSGTILYCNARFAEILGLPMEAVLGQSLLQFVISSDYPKAKTLLEQRTDGKSRGELTLSGGKAVEVPVGISLKELTLDGELRLGIVVTDLTEYKQIESELEKYRQHLEELVTERTVQLEAANTDLLKEITERKQAEQIQRQLTETLAQRLAELQTLLDVVPVGIAIGHDSEGRVITVNRLLSEWLTAPTGTNVSLSTPEEERQVSYQVLRQGRPAQVEELPIQFAALNARGVRNDEFSIVRSDGRIIEMLANAEPIFDDQGYVRGSVATYVDITERKRAEAERDWLASFPERNPNPIVELEYSGVIVYLNPKSRELFPGLASSGLKHPLLASLEPFIQKFKTGESETTFTQEVKVGEVYFHQTIVNIPESERIRLYHVDITKRKQVEEHVAYQARLLANVNDAIVGSDVQFRLNVWNTSAESMYGWKAEEVLGRNGLELLRTEWPQKDAEVMRSTIAETGRWRGEATQLRKDGTRIPVEVSSMVLRDESGQITGYVSVNHEITERKQAEEALARQAEDLRRSNTELEQFAYVASHDLQEPLRIMSSFSQLLQKRYKDRLDQDASEFIAFIVDAAARMQKLITDLLAYSRAGHGDTDMVEVDCDRLVRNLVKSMAVTIETADGQVTFDKLPVVTAREASMIQLFQNLIGNALKFRGDQPPRVHVSAQQAEDEWVFSVRDNGIGIEPQYSQRIFMIFQRLHARDKYAGTGIGLSICKKIVENMGGRIWVESEPGRGSTFTFTCPFKKTSM